MNHLPSPKKLLRDAVNQCTPLLSDLGAKIVDIRDLLQQLFQERTKVADNIAIAKNLLHPIRRLPTDVLGEIFSACAESPVQCLFSNFNVDSMDLLQGPWAISHVSRRWRDIVTNTAKLWSCISVVFPMWTSRNSGLTSMLSCYIERSKDLKLTLVVCSENDISDHAALSLLHSTSNRWRDVVLAVPSRTIQTLSFSFCEGSFGNLRYLHIDFIDGDGCINSATPLLNAFEQSPKLTHVAFSHVGDLLQVFSLPWSQVTVYDGPDSPDDEHIIEMPHLHVLTKIPLLESMRLYCDKHSTIPASGRVHLPRLQNLTLEEGYSAVAGSLSQCISALSLPSLTELMLAYSNPTNQVQHPSIIYPTGINASKITILQLTFRFRLSPVDIHNILVFLSSVSWLTCLDFRGSTVELQKPYVLSLC